VVGEQASLRAVAPLPPHFSDKPPQNPDEEDQVAYQQLPKNDSPFLVQGELGNALKSVHVLELPFHAQRMRYRFELDERHHDQNRNEQAKAR